MKLTYDSKGRDITCMKEFSALKYPCRECNVIDCDEREEENMKKMKLSDIKIRDCFKEATPKEEKMNEKE